MTQITESQLESYFSYEQFKDEPGFTRVAVHPGMGQRRRWDYGCSQVASPSQALESADERPLVEDGGVLHERPPKLQISASVSVPTFFTCGFQILSGIQAGAK